MMHRVRVSIITLGLGFFLAVTNLNGQTIITFFPEVNPPFSPSGNWHEPLDWNPAIVPNDGLAKAVIAAGAVYLNADAAIGSLLLQGPSGSISQGGDDTRKTLTVNGRSTWTGGSISSDVNIHAYGGIDLSGSEEKQINTSSSGGGNYFQPILRVRGDSTWEGGRVDGQIVNGIPNGRPLFDFQSGTFTITSGNIFSPQLLNAGTVTVDPGEGAKTILEFLTNNGTVHLLSGTTDMDAFLSSGDLTPTSAGDFLIDQGATLLLAGHTLTNASSITGAGAVVLSGSIATDFVTVGGAYAMTGVTSLRGDVVFANDATTGGLVISASSGELTGKITASDLIVWEGEGFGGTGEIVGLRGVDFSPEYNTEMYGSLTLTLSGNSAWTGTRRVALAGTSHINQLAGGTWTINGDRSLEDALFDGGAGTITNAGTITQTAGRTFVGPDTTNTGTLIAKTGATLMFTSLTHSGGEIRLEGGTFGGALTALGGRIIGNGAVIAAATASNTILAPGAAGSSGTGRLDFQQLTMGSGCIFAAEIGGNTPDKYDQLYSGGPTLTIGGSLQVRFHDGFQSAISAADTFTIAEVRTSILGSFTNAAPGTRLATADGMGSFIVDYGPSSPTGQKLIVLRSFEAAANPPEEPTITSITSTPSNIALAWSSFGDRTNYTIETSTSGSNWTAAKVIADGATTSSLPRSGTRRFYRVTSP